MGTPLRPKYISLYIYIQVPNIHILTRNLRFNYHYPKTKYLIIGYLDPLGMYIYIYIH